MPYRTEHKQLKIDSIEKNPWNPNVMSERVYEAEKESITEFGMIDPITVRPHPDDPKKYQIIDGEHRWRVCSELGHKTIPAEIIHDLSDAQAKKLTLILNETRGRADRIELAQLLAEIQVDFGDDLIKGLPYHADELDELIRLADINWNPDDGAGEIDGDGGQNDADNDDWVTFTVKMPREAYDRAVDAYQLLDQERGGLHQEKAIACPQAIESLAADYIAAPR